MIGSLGGHEGQFSRDPVPVFSAGGLWEQLWNGQICPVFDVVHPAFPLQVTMSPTLQGALKDGFGEVVMAYDMPEPCKFPSLDSCQKRFLQTHKEADLALYPLRGHVLQVGDTEKFPHALGFEAWTFFFFSVRKQGPCFSAIEENGGDERLVQLELACEADGLALPDPL